MKILFIAPIPPPINGQSKASQVLLDKLHQEKNDVIVVNLSKKSLKNGFSSFWRVFEIFVTLKKIWRTKNNIDLIYLSVAESFLGNIRDLLIYSICYKNRHKIFIHMLGGAGMKKIIEGKGLLQKINSFFISELAGVIVEGPHNYEFYSKVISSNKIYVIPNFAEDYLFVTDTEITNKFLDKKDFQILYLSNLITGKGYNELADAYLELPDEFKKHINIVFVGGFESNKYKNDFLSKIKSHNGLKYIGKFIDGENKRELFCQSQVFCLPTYYPYEGQPISILEAYATGCVVITTNHSGIPFIFSDVENGFMVTKMSVQSIKEAIEKLFSNSNKLQKIAIVNRDLAMKKYRTAIYQKSISKIFQDFIRK